MDRSTRPTLRRTCSRSFLKRISDVFDEERAAALEESGGDQEYANLPEQHRFQIPDGCHWSDLRSRSTNVGQAIQLLIDLIDHFSQLDLRNAVVPNDVLGDAYEYLIKKFADLTNRKAGEFYTPRSVVRLMVRMLAPQAGETVYDPACGTGGMLLETVHQVRTAGGDTRMMLGRLFGQEKNLTTAAIARMNLFLHGAEDFDIVRGDTLRQPAFLSGDKLATFDCVIANPPFSLGRWGEELWPNDPWGRNIGGTPSHEFGDWAWVQHMISSMAPVSGRMAVVLPNGALFRTKSETTIQNRVLDLDVIEAVIALGPNLFYGTGLAACILIARRQKAPSRQGLILLIDGSELYRRGRNQNTLEPDHVTALYNAYEAFSNEDGRARIVSLDEIRDHGGTLNVATYVTAQREPDAIFVEGAARSLEQSLDELRAAAAYLDRLLGERGIA